MTGQPLNKTLDEVLGIISEDIKLYYSTTLHGTLSNRELINSIADMVYSTSDMPRELQQNIDAFKLCPALSHAVGINRSAKEAETLCRYAGFVSHTYGYTADKLLLNGKKLAAA